MPEIKFEVMGLRYGLDETGQERVLINSFTVWTFVLESDAQRVCEVLNKNTATAAVAGLEYIVSQALVYPASEADKLTDVAF